MLKILKGIKNIFVHIRSSLKLIIMIIISAIIIVGIIFTFYRPTYSVTLNGEFVGYTNDKNGLQKKINELNDKEKEIILLRYYKQKTQMQVSKILGITQVQVSRIERKVLDKMKKRLSG